MRRSEWGLGLLAAALCAANVSAAQDQPGGSGLKLSLTCSGKGTIKKNDFTPAGNPTVRTTHPKETMYLDFDDAGARIYLPPDLNIGGGPQNEQGGRSLILLSVTDTAVTAQIDFGKDFWGNRMYASIVIDRLHGAFDTKGLLSDGFWGMCKANKGDRKPKF